MKRQAAGAPPKLKMRRTLTAHALQTLRFTDFAGEIIVLRAEHGKVLLAISHADTHTPHFVQQSFGWEVA